MKKIISSIMIFFFIAGCSTSPDKISASYVSPLQYQDYSCNQIRAELMRVNRKILEVTGAQQKEADKDAAAMGIGLILFWPALFFLIGDDKKTELANLKGEYEALEVAAIQQECEVAKELEEVRRQREKYEEERKKQQESSMEDDEDDY